VKLEKLTKNSELRGHSEWQLCIKSVDTYKTVQSISQVSDVYVHTQCPFYRVLQYEKPASAQTSQDTLKKDVDQAYPASRHMLVLRRFSPSNHETANWFCNQISAPYNEVSRSQWPRGLKGRYADARLLRLWVRIPPRAWTFVCFECCVLSARGLCDELITSREESYRMWCGVV
jgi:hypothetical protein